MTYTKNMNPHTANTTSDDEGEKKSKSVSRHRLGRVNVRSLAILASLSVTFAPFLVSAQATDFKSLVSIIMGLIRSLIPLVVALTLLVFIWGIFQLVRSNSSKDREAALGLITYGIISLFVMVSVWGLVYILTSTFFNGALVIPQLR